MTTKDITKTSGRICLKSPCTGGGWWVEEREVRGGEVAFPGKQPAATLRSGKVKSKWERNFVTIDLVENVEKKPLAHGQAGT